MDARKSRSERSTQTRDRVIEQARNIFLAKGFAATTTREVAAAAGVTERTLFNLVTSKGDLLTQVVSKFVYSQDQGPLLERPDFVAVLAATSREQLLHEFARWCANLHERTSPVAEMVRAASPVDQGAAATWAYGAERQVVDCRNVILLVKRRGWLAVTVDIERAAESIATLSGHETYWKFITGRHWSPQQYCEWLYRHCQLDLPNTAGGSSPNDAVLESLWS